MADKVAATIKLTERLIQNNNCIGYTAVDLKGNTATLNKDTALRYAEQGKIYKVAYRNTENGPVLYGINGFKVNELPEIVKDKQATIQINAVYIREKAIVGYLMTDTITRKQLKIDIKSAVKLLNDKKLIGITTINDLKGFNKNIIQLETATSTTINKESITETLKYYQEAKKELLRLLNEYIRVVEVSGTGENGEKAKIVSKINQIEAVIASGKITKESLDKQIVYMKNALLGMIKNKSNIAKSSMLNQLVGSLESSLTKISKLNIKYRKAVESNILNIKNEMTDLRNIENFEKFVQKYQDIKKLLCEIDEKALKVYKLQEDEMNKIRLRETYISNELNGIADNELKGIKKKIVETPWYIRYKTLMNSNSYLQTCIIQDNAGKKIRLIDVDITENFVGKQRAGFTLKYKGKTYEYREKLTNMSLIASFMRIANDTGLENGTVSAKFKRDDNTVLTLTV